MILSVSYCVERGQNKNSCDDTVLAGSKIINEENGTIIIEVPAWVCLCDGVGGNAGGRDASIFVCHALSLEKVSDSIDSLGFLIRQTNKDLLTKAEETADHKLMATTATILAFSENGVLLAHIGNTRLYSVRGQFLQQITTDHTTYQWLLDRGDEETARSCNRSEIRGAMGGGRQELINPLIVINPFERKIPSKLLLTSDGVHEFLNEDEMEGIIGDSFSDDLEKTILLCQTALKNGSEDDRSAVIIKVY